MEKEVVAALMTSIASVIVAVFAFIQSAKSSKRSMLMNKEIESMKQSYDKKKSDYIILSDDKRKLFNSLCEFISEIQAYKDYLFFLINTSKKSYDSESALKLLTKRTQLILNCFKNLSVHINKYETLGNAAHEVKNLIAYKEIELHELFSKRKYTNLEKEEKKGLSQMRLKLDEFQNLLRDSREEILFKIDDD